MVYVLQVSLDAHQATHCFSQCSDQTADLMIPKITSSERSTDGGRCRWSESDGWQIVVGVDVVDDRPTAFYCFQREQQTILCLEY